MNAAHVQGVTEASLQVQILQAWKKFRWDILGMLNWKFALLPMWLCLQMFWEILSSWERSRGYFPADGETFGP